MSTAVTLANHAMAGQGLSTANRVSHAASSGSTGGNSSTAENTSAGITANDFLTLLVTEMKNQDPTANTDPNEYINQLVNVNSLEQLISINETLTGAFGSSSSGVDAKAATQATHDSAKPGSGTIAEVNTDSTSNPSSATGLAATNSTPADPNVYSVLSNLVHGNLSVPGQTGAVDRLTHALDGHSDVPSMK